MKTLFRSAIIFCCLLCLSATGQPAQSIDLTRTLLSPEIWKGEPLPGKWETASKTDHEVIKKLTTPRTLFVTKPKRVYAYYHDGSLWQVVVIFMERGYNMDLFKGPPKDQQATYITNFAMLKAELPRAIEREVKSKPRPALVSGAGANFVFEFQEYVYRDLSLRLRIDGQRVIALTLCRTKEASTNLMMFDPIERSKRLAQNVVRSETGDVLLKNVPMFDQDGRPYCGPAVWAMVARHYGLNVFPELMLADGRDGGKGVEVAARMKKGWQKTFDFERMARSIDSGNPIWFSAPGHVALVTGYNREKNQIFRTDSWGEGSRNKKWSVPSFLKQANAFMYMEAIP